MAKKKKSPPISMQLIPHCWRMMKQKPATILWPLINTLITLLLIFYVSHPIIQHFTAGSSWNKHTTFQLLIFFALCMGKGLTHACFNYATLCQIHASKQSNHQTPRSTYSPLKQAWKRILCVEITTLLITPLLFLVNRLYYGYCILVSKPVPMNPYVILSLLPCSILLENQSALASYEATHQRLKATWRSNNLTKNTSSGMIDFMYLMISITPAALGFLFSQNNSTMLHISIGCSAACFLATSVFHHFCHLVAMIELYHHSLQLDEANDHSLDFEQAFIPIVTQSPFKTAKTP